MKNEDTEMILTVCRSLRNKINVTKPEPIAKGSKLIIAKHLPSQSPKKRSGKFS